MLFSSMSFLVLFLPVTLAGYFLLPKALKNLWLLAVSMVFYAWGEPDFVVIMAASIAINMDSGWRQTGFGITNMGAESF